MSENKTTWLQIRVTPSLKQQLYAWADEEKRSASAQVVLVIERALAEARRESAIHGIVEHSDQRGNGSQGG